MGDNVRHYSSLVVPVTSELTEIVVVGNDKTGLIARITTLLFERNINIEDLDQAIRDGVFRMTMHVNTDEMSVEPAALRDALYELGGDLGVDIQVRFPADREVSRLAVLVTKESHCLEALTDTRLNGGLDAEISVIISNHDTLAAIAEEHEIPFYDIGDDSGSPNEAWLLDILEEYDIDLVVLARYMRILSPNVVFRYESRIINIHPSLLPAFPGAAAYQQAREEGVRIAGVTAHYVTTDLDQGPIITQRAFSVPDGESAEDLEQRGQPLEAEALIEAVKLHLNDTISVYHGRTHMRDDGDESDDDRDGDEQNYQLGLPSVVENTNADEPIDQHADLDELDD
jgi:formyltetrahydrofolate deformylase